MEVFYHRDVRGNFGDDLNQTFFDEVCPNYRSAPYEKMYGIGTLLNNAHGLIKNTLIFGSGYGQGRAPDIDLKTTRILGIRGPVTAKALNIDPETYVIGDPALYLPKIPSFNTSTLKKGSIVICVHHRTAEEWNLPSDSINDVYFLDPGAHSVNDYISIIRHADLVLAEAMHGAIVAMAYRIPFVRVKFLGKLDDTKWDDTLLSVGAKPKTPVQLPTPEASEIRRYTRALCRKTQQKKAFSVFPGRKLTEKEITNILNSVDLIKNDNDPLIVSDAAVDRAQSRIESKIGELRKLCG